MTGDLLSREQQVYRITSKGDSEKGPIIGRRTKLSIRTQQKIEIVTRT